MWTGSNYIQPVPYVDLSEVSFKPDAHKGDKDSNALMYMSGNLSANEVEMTIYAAKEKKPQFFVPKGTVKTKGKEIVYNQSSAIKYKYFYQCVDDHCEFENIKKGDFLFYSKGEFTKINTKSQDELKSYVKISYNTYYSLFKKCYGDVPLNMIEISYQDYCDLQDKYVVTVYNHIHKP